MKAFLVVLCGAAVLVAAAPGTAAKPPVAISIEFSDYRPDLLDVLPGETVSWTNISARTHTVTSDTGLFDSGHVIGGARFAFRFNQVGAYLYHCTIHPAIAGEVDVRQVTLDTLPPAAVPTGTKVEFTGRTAHAGRPVLIQRRIGSVYKTVATATPHQNGNWRAVLAASATGAYRAATRGGVSETRRLLVESRRLIVKATSTGVDVTVAPSAPYARFLVEVYLRERFGWWPVARGRLDYVSTAEVPVHAPARVRIVLVDEDGWTPLVTSKVIVLR